MGSRPRRPKRGPPATARSLPPERGRDDRPRGPWGDGGSVRAPPPTATGPRGPSGSGDPNPRAPCDEADSPSALRPLPRRHPRRKRSPAPARARGAEGRRGGALAHDAVLQAAVQRAAAVRAGARKLPATPFVGALLTGHAPPGRHAECGRSVPAGGNVEVAPYEAAVRS